MEKEELRMEDLEMGSGEMVEVEDEMSLFRTCQEVSEADFKFVEQCAEEKDNREEVRDILMERLVMKAWKIYEGGN